MASRKAAGNSGREAGTRHIGCAMSPAENGIVPRGANYFACGSSASWPNVPARQGISVGRGDDHMFLGRMHGRAHTVSAGGRDAALLTGSIASATTPH
jgi:hypothetical protein